MGEQAGQRARFVRCAELEFAAMQQANGTRGRGEFLTQAAAGLKVIDGGTHDGLQHRFAEGFGDVIIGAGINALDDVLFAGETG